MVRLGSMAAAIALLTCSTTLADVLCVQQELARLGFDPGPADGALGKQTLRAAADFQKGAPYFSDLTTDTTLEWCNRLRTVPIPDARIAVTLSIHDPLANAGAISGDAIRATPVLGETPEYQVPKWVGP